ncbi:MAG: protein phosphatase 2C domain-containing protein [Zoogloeaceae bacterium]|jgi:protein phosphatase|nr:protein phosphatase 2C domain-containing protein [Zoogloeaceae bacterium]
MSEALETLVVTDVGLVRRNNEDAVSALPEQGLMLLADGMGGYNAGEVASNMAVVVLARKLGQVDFSLLTPEAALEATLEQVRETNRIIYQAGLDHLNYVGMGTTLVLGRFCGDKLHIVHLGDSRAYRFRNGTLERLTRDHSPVQDLIDAGLLTEDIARRSYGKHLVNRALGIAPEVEPEGHIHTVQVGDLYLFCSDGLVDMVDDAEIARILASPDARLFEMGERLLYQANGNGGLDNISIILTRVETLFPVESQMNRTSFPPG